MFSRDLTLARFDADLFAAMQQEAKRQEDHIELIASENYTSPAVMEAQGSVLTNKYAEGYPGKRYYGGCEYVDVVEQLAIDRAKELFGADYANVQPHAGSQANAAVYLALLSAGDTILGMSLAHGGHLTHGASVSSSGKLYNAVQYGINDQGLIDYDEVERRRRAQAEDDRRRFLRLFTEAGLCPLPRDRRQGRCLSLRRHGSRGRSGRRRRLRTRCPSPTWSPPLPTRPCAARGLILAKKNEEIEKKLNSAVFPGAQGGPLEHVIAAKAVCFKEALQPEFKAYQQQVVKNAQAMAEVFIQRGFDVVSGGTQNHLFLLSLIKQDITGKDADAALGRAHITVNKNSVPNDPRSPFVTSGLRIGTPAVTTRGFGEAECRELAGWICDILDNMGDESVIDAVRGKVEAVCAKFPVYGN